MKIPRNRTTRWSLALAGLLGLVLVGVTPIGSNAASHPEFVSNLYIDVLHRQADGPGLAGWVAGLDRGLLTRHQVALGFVNSPEFQGSHAPFTVSLAAAESAGPGPGFLTALYATLLRRDADPAGAAFFGGLMASGYSNVDIARMIYLSSEAVHGRLQRYYQDFLGRHADVSGLDSWTAAIQNGWSDEQVIAAILASDEYFLRRRVVHVGPSNSSSGGGDGGGGGGDAAPAIVLSSIGSDSGNPLVENPEPASLLLLGSGALLLGRAVWKRRRSAA